MKFITKINKDYPELLSSISILMFSIIAFISANYVIITMYSSISKLLISLFVIYFLVNIVTIMYYSHRCYIRLRYPLKSKHPNDLVYTIGNSTMWTVVEYYCRACDKDLTISDITSGSCPNCSTVNFSLPKAKKFRKIYNNHKWRYQFLYVDEINQIKSEIRETYYKQ